MNNLHYPMFEIHIGDLCISSVLDNGFVSVSDTAPEIHAHAFYELILATNGEIEIDIRNADISTRLIIKGDEACIIPPDIYHCTRGTTTESVKLAIRFSCVQTESKNDGPSVFKTCSRVLTGLTSPLIIPCGEVIRKTMCEIRDEFHCPDIASREYVKLMLGRLYLDLFRMMDKNKILIKEKSSPLIQTDGVQERKIKIEEYIFLHFPNQITEDDLAKEMHLSKRQLSRVIDKLFGKTFKQMLCDVRLNRAAQLLIESDASVDDIAYSVGYTSLSGFYTAFRNKFSLSAGQYRRAFNTK